MKSAGPAFGPTDDVGRGLFALATASSGLAGQRNLWASLDAVSLFALDDDEAEVGDE